MSFSAQVFSFRVFAVLGPILILLGFQLIVFEPASAEASSTDLQFFPLPIVPENESSPNPLLLYGETTVCAFAAKFPTISKIYRRLIRLMMF